MKALPGTDWYRDTILQILYEKGGSLSRQLVLGYMTEILEQVYGTEWPRVEDSTRATDNTPRWQHRADAVRQRMAHKEHLLTTDSPRGTWALTPEGIAEAKLVS